MEPQRQRPFRRWLAVLGGLGLCLAVAPMNPVGAASGTVVIFSNGSGTTEVDLPDVQIDLTTTTLRPSGDHSLLLVSNVEDPAQYFALLYQPGFSRRPIGFDGRLSLSAGRYRIDVITNGEADFRLALAGINSDFIPTFRPIASATTGSPIAPVVPGAAVGSVTNAIDVPAGASPGVVVATYLQSDGPIDGVRIGSCVVPADDGTTRPPCEAGQGTGSFDSSGVSTEGSRVRIHFHPGQAPDQSTNFGAGPVDASSYIQGAQPAQSMASFVAAFAA